MVSKGVGVGAAVAIAGLCLIAPVLADETSPDTGGGRYAFNKVADGFLRLDTQTGELSLCSQRPVGWACQVVPEDRAVLEDQIARLRRENGALKQELLSHGLSLPAGAAVPEPPVAHSSGRQPRLADRADFDRMMTFVGQVWHRLVEVIAQAQKQVLNKS